MEAEGRIIGCLLLSFLPGISHKGMWRGQVESVRIAGDLRGRGLGHKLMQWAIGECRKRGCGQVQLSTNLSRTRRLSGFTLNPSASSTSHVKA